MNQGVTYDPPAVLAAMRESGLFISLCTITQPPDAVLPADQAFGPSGAPLASVPYVPLAGHIDIPCTAPPISIGDRVQPTELKELAEIVAKSALHVLLLGYYPAITSDHRAVVDGVEYDIAGQESDSQKQMTRIALTKVSI